MSHKIRLGPIAVFLAIVAIVLSVMAVLSTATTHADRVMAERFAEMTQQRYALEAEGTKLLAEYDRQAAAGAVEAESLGLSPAEGGGYRTQIEKGGYILTMALSEPDGQGSYTVDEWKITKQWNADDPFQNIWKGE